VTSSGIAYSKNVKDLSQLAAGEWGGFGGRDHSASLSQDLGHMTKPNSKFSLTAFNLASTTISRLTLHPASLLPKYPDDQLANEEAAAMAAANGNVPGYCADRVLRAQAGGSGCPPFYQF
jgi:hypothetical protein